MNKYELEVNATYKNPQALSEALPVIVVIKQQANLSRQKMITSSDMQWK